MASGNQLNQARQGNESTQGGKSARGFASMDPERQRAIASEGGRAAHQRWQNALLSRNPTKRAWATVNKTSGGKNSGLGRGKYRRATNRPRVR